MVQVIIGILVILNLYGIAVKRNNKLIIVISCVIILLIMGLNTFTSDFPYYKSYYNTQVFSMSFELGFVAFSKLVYLLGFDYQGFLVVYFLLCLIVMAFAIRNMGANIHCILFLYVLTQMFMDTNEIRQTMSYCLFALALSDYAKSNNRFRYCMLLIASTLFHRSTILFLPFLLLFDGIKNRKKILKIYFSTIALFCIVVFANGNRIPGLNQLLIVFGLPDKAAYFETSTHYGFLLMWAAYFSNMFIVYMAKRVMNRYPDLYDEVKMRYVGNLWEVLLYSAFAMPLCMLNSEFLRYYRFTVLPVIIVLSIMIKKKTYNPRKHSVIQLARFDLYIYLYLIIYTFTFQHWRVLGEVVDNNLLNQFF